MYKQLVLLQFFHLTVQVRQHKIRLRGLASSSCKADLTAISYYCAGIKVRTAHPL